MLKGTIAVDSPISQLYTCCVVENTQAEVCITSLLDCRSVRLKHWGGYSNLTYSGVVANGVADLSLSNPTGCSLCKYGEPLPVPCGVGDTGNSCTVPTFMMTRASDNACLSCDFECLDGCTEENNPEACLACRNFNNSGVCVPFCPDSTYHDNNQNCISCNAACQTSFCNGGDSCSCAGPTADDCDECLHFELETLVNGIYRSTCLVENETCPNGYYTTVSEQLCRQCSTQCDTGATCSGPLPSQCVLCAGVSTGTSCESTCPVGTWADPSDRILGVLGAQPALCTPCSDLCSGGCQLPADINTTALAVLTRQERIQLTAAYCRVPGLAGCKAGNTLYDPNTVTFGTIGATGTCTSLNGCPTGSFPDYSTRLCTECDAQCLVGCIGVGPRNCSVDTYTSSPLCKNYFVDVNVLTLQGTGVPECVATCPPPGSTTGWVAVSLNGQSQCIPCSDKCAVDQHDGLSCTASTPRTCNKCATAEQKRFDAQSGAAYYECVDECDDGYELQNITTAMSSGYILGPNPIPADFVCNECPFTLPVLDLCLPSCNENLQGTGLLYPSGPQTCAQCHAQCAVGCFGPTAANCLGETEEKCVHVQTLIGTQMTCVTSCEAFQYLPVESTVCQSCPVPCQAQSALSCCVEDDASVGPVCGYTHNATCATCHDTCDGCTGSGPGNCIACRFFSLEDECVLECPEGYFEDVANKQCRPCHVQCLDACYGPTNTDCATCASTKLNGACIASCPSNTVQVPAVVTNATPIDNTQIPATRAFCATCDQVEHFEDVDGNCVACSAQCAAGASCTGPAAHECLPFNATQCKYFQLTNGTCVQSCPRNMYATFVASGDNKCLPCSAQCDESLGCSGPGPFACTRCKHVQMKDTDGQCVDACPASHYLTTDARFCRRCSSLCTACTGPSAAECGQNCVANAVYDDANGCTTQCPLGKYTGGAELTSTPVCAACHSTCEPNPPAGERVCTGGGSDQCNECMNFNIVNGTTRSCVNTCPVGTFANYETSACEPCNSQCVYSCTGPGPDLCILAEQYPTSVDLINLQHTIRFYQPSQAVVVNTSMVVQIERAVQRALNEFFGSVVLIGSSNVPPKGAYPAGVAVGYRRSAAVASEMQTTALMESIVSGVSCAQQPSAEHCLLGVLGNDVAGFFNPPTRAVADTAVDVVRYQIPCTDVLSEQTCTTACPPAQYEDGSRICRACNTVCTTCTSSLAADCDPNTCRYASRNGACLAACNTSNELQVPGTIACVPCSQECAEQGCVGPTAGDCNVCKVHEINGICYSQCPVGYVEASGKCVDACPSDTYEDANGVCQRCHPLCNGCSGPALAQCTACREVRGIDGRCTDTCGPKTYRDNAQCKSCHPQCTSACFGSASTQCLVGNSTRKCMGAVLELDNGQFSCVAECPAGKHFDATDTTSAITHGGFLCGECESGYSCATGGAQQPCPLNQFTCNRGATACLPCPPSRQGQCVFNFAKGAMDSVECEDAYDFDPATCGCIFNGLQTQEPEAATADNAAASIDTELLIAIAAG